MTIKFRNYRGYEDFELIGDFLIRHYQEDNKDGNWFQPTWEYMHYHPSLQEEHLGRIGIWENEGEITGVVHYESELVEAFLQVHPDYKHLKNDMLEYAEKNLHGDLDGRESVITYINDYDEELKEIAKARGYHEEPKYKRPLMKFTIPEVFPEIKLPEGFKLKSLADDNDLHKINRVLWRGFNHEGEAPEEGIAGRIKMQSGPNFRKDLTIVVEAPDGNFVAFCGMWYDKVNKIAYVEPVATDPDYRRMGLGKAAVHEGIRRCGELGATVAYVGSLQDFYFGIGFEKLYEGRSYIKYLD